MSSKQLLKKLERAYVCCEECGTRWGQYKGGCSSWWEDVCDVCGEVNAVTEVRDWRYLDKGMVELRRRILDETKDKTGAKAVV